jgi:hypothetical protein
MKEKKCYYCNATPYGQTSNIAIQRFNDGTIGSVSLNPCNTTLLTASTCCIPDKGANDYRVIGKINYCPICGRKLI